MHRLLEFHKLWYILFSCLYGRGDVIPNVDVRMKCVDPFLELKLKISDDWIQANGAVYDPQLGHFIPQLKQISIAKTAQIPKLHEQNVPTINSKTDKTESSSTVMKIVEKKSNSRAYQITDVYSNHLKIHIK